MRREHKARTFVHASCGILDLLCVPSAQRFVARKHQQLGLSEVGSDMDVASAESRPGQAEPGGAEQQVDAVVARTLPVTGGSGDQATTTRPLLAACGAVCYVPRDFFEQCDHLGRWFPSWRSLRSSCAVAGHHTTVANRYTRSQSVPLMRPLLLLEILLVQSWWPPQRAMLRLLSRNNG